MPTDLDSTPEFSQYFAEIQAPKPDFIVELTNGRPSLVFRRTKDWADYQAIKEAASMQMKAAIEGTMHPEWKPYAQDPMVVGRVTHLARRHVGIFKDGEVIPEQWGELHFLKMAKHDPHAFQSLIDSLNEHIAVGWRVEDRDYFREDAKGDREEPNGDAGASGGAADVESAPTAA